MLTEQRMKLLGLKIYRSPDDSGGKGGTDDAGDEGKGSPAADKNGDAAKGDSNGDGGKPLIDLDNPPAKAGEKPAWMPDTAWDGEKKTVKVDVALTEWEKANARAEGLRKELSKAPQKAPAKVEDYRLPEFKDEKDKALTTMLKADDPFIKKVTEFAHKHGLSQSQYEGFLSDVGRELAAEAGKEGDSKGPSKEEAEEYAKQQLDLIGPNGPRVAAAVSEFLLQKKSQGIFDDEMIGELKALSVTASGLKILNAWRSDAGGESIPLGDSITVDGLLTDGEIFGMYGTKAFNDPSDPGHAEMHVKVNRQLDLRRKAGRPERLAT